MTTDEGTARDEVARLCRSLSDQGSFGWHDLERDGPSDRCIAQRGKSVDGRQRQPHGADVTCDPRMAKATCAEWHCIPPAKPIQNGLGESLKGRFREKCLNEHLFPSLSAARCSPPHRGLARRLHPRSTAHQPGRPSTRTSLRPGPDRTQLGRPEQAARQPSAVACGEDRFDSKSGDSEGRRAPSGCGAAKRKRPPLMVTGRHGQPGKACQVPRHRSSRRAAPCAGQAISISIRGANCWPPWRSASAG